MPEPFERLRKLLDLVRKLGPNINAILEALKGLDLSKLEELFSLIAELNSIPEPANTKAGIIARVEVGLRIAKLWSLMTPGTLDDTFVGAVDVVLGNPATLEWIAELVSRLLPTNGREFIAVTPQRFGDVVVKNDETQMTAFGMNYAQVHELAGFLATLLAP